jgi:cytochrome c2
MKITANVLTFTLVAIMAIMAVSVSLDAQIEIVPGSALRGEGLFTNKGCIGCHAIAGEGGTRAPDLASRSVRTYSPELLSSVMWNHGPEMWQAMAESNTPIPEFTSTEAADLYSYFYAQLYFSVPGDAGRGRQVFVDKNCSQCHASTQEENSDATIGPAVSTWGRVRDPIAWAERMWNHSEEMYARMQEASIPWPELTTQESVDLLVYFRNLPETQSSLAEFEPGEAEQGLVVFTRSCEGCHSFGPSLPGRIDLLERPGPKTFTGYATTMWNHAPLMQARAQGALPDLEDGAMNHLVAYLFAQRYFSDPGDVEAGALVFENKECVVCHQQDRPASGAPDLTRSAERYSPITMTRSLWMHGPEMLEQLDERGMDWPVFEGSEMADLIAFLNSRLVAIIAATAGAQ